MNLNRTRTLIIKAGNGLHNQINRTDKYKDNDHLGKIILIDMVEATMEEEVDIKMDEVTEEEAFREDIAVLVTTGEEVMDRVTEGHMEVTEEEAMEEDFATTGEGVMEEVEDIKDLESFIKGFNDS